MVFTANEIRTKFKEMWDKIRPETLKTRHNITRVIPALIRGLHQKILINCLFDEILKYIIPCGIYISPFYKE